MVEKRSDAAEYFREYSSKTSIHGFQYFGEKRPIFEKILWIIIFVICCSICTLSIVIVYRKWDSSPVIVVFDTQPIKIHEIPFPAITVCSQSKVKINIFNITDAFERKRKYGILNETEEKIFNYLAAVCDYEDDFNYTNIENDEFFNLMEEIVPPVIPTNCWFRGRQVDCDEYFTPIITDQGICSTFNILDRDELFNDNVIHFKHYHQVGYNSSLWDNANGYAEGSPIEEVYPKRALISGARYYMSFDLTVEADEISNACRDFEGFIVMIHSPIGTPAASQQFVMVPLDHTVIASLTPTIISTSDNVKKFPPSKRQCYFQTEIKLKYFRLYSQMNCFMENLTNITLQYCNCVDFYMPRDNTTRICGGQDNVCVYDAEELLHIIHLENLIEKKDITGMHKPMECLPLCTDISYQASTSLTKWHWTNDKIKTIYKSRFAAYFRGSNYIGSERVELYGPTDFLANFGGLLGLFTGFSFLSLMEMIYFLTVRLWCNRKMYGQISTPDV